MNRFHFRLADFAVGDFTLQAQDEIPLRVRWLDTALALWAEPFGRGGGANPDAERKESRSATIPKLRQAGALPKVKSSYIA